MAKWLKILALLACVGLCLPLAAEDVTGDPLDRLTGIDLVAKRLEFPGVSARIPLEALTGTTHNELELGPCVEKVVVDIDYEQMTVKDALRRMAREYGFVYTVPSHDKLIVDVALEPGTRTCERKSGE
ncbi:hypothetical protein ABI59_19060 [Acidobacteria bacterium Mor1]|nr:hypothetical protein ABI59_19060 [Acidobacteria bacterium Mor1]